MKTYTNEELLLLITDYYAKHGTTPTVAELPVSKELYRRRFGSYTHALSLANVEPNRRPGADTVIVCLVCGTQIKTYSKTQKYCSHSCRASQTNTTRTRTVKPTAECVVCGKRHTNKLYCSKVCQQQSVADRFAAGEVLARSTLKKHVGSTECECCGITEWLGQPLSLELDHIDGDASNNAPSNLRMLCPNCHSITPTWKARNKGKGRKARGISLG